MGDLTDYNEEDPKGVGAYLLTVYDAAKDGVQITQDMPVVMTFLSKLVASANELAGDTVSAGLHTVSGLTDAIADARIKELKAQQEAGG
jgi:hypothetical protein